MFPTFTFRARLTLCGAAAISGLFAIAVSAQDANNANSANNPQTSSNNTGSVPGNGNPPTQLPPFSGANAAAQATADQTLGMSFANTQALTISGIADSSPLTNLGLQVGDQIYAFNGQALGGNPNTLMNRVITASRSGQPASLTVYRNGEQVSVNVPANALQAVAQARNQLGVTRPTVANNANQANQQTALSAGGNQAAANARTQTGQNTSASGSAGGTGAAGTGSAIASGAGTLNLSSSGSGASGATTNNDASAAVNAVAGFQNGGQGGATNQAALAVNEGQNQNVLNSFGQSLGLTFADTPGNSLTITSVAPNSPFSGILQAGDRLTSFDGRPLDNPMSLFSQLSLAARGDQSATLSVMRGGTSQTVNLSNSLLDNIAQIQQNQLRLPGEADRFASRANTAQNNNRNSTQNANQNSAQNGTQTGNSLAATGSGNGDRERENSDLPTTVITPNGPRIVAPGQSEGQGRSGAGNGSGAGNVGGGTGVRVTPPTGPSGKAASGGARAAAGGAAAGAGARVGGS